MTAPTPPPAALRERVTAFHKISDAAREHGWTGVPARPISIFKRANKSVTVRFNRNGTVRHADLRVGPDAADLLEYVGQGNRDRRASVLRWITA